MTQLAALPQSFSATREALRALSCYVIAPARFARFGMIQLVPAGDALGTPPFDDGTQILVRGDRLHDGDRNAPITTLTAAATFLGIELRSDLPYVGADLPPFEPDTALDVDAPAGVALARWYTFGGQLLEDLRATIVPPEELSEAHLWPEHFDLGVVLTGDDGWGVNVGVSPGDSYLDDPYVYVGPWDTSALDDPFWNAPFGATLGRTELATHTNPRRAAADFFAAGLAKARRT